MARTDVLPETIGPVGGSRPTVLLRLASLFIFLTIFDDRVISNIPFARTVSALCGLVLMGLFILRRGRTYRLYRGPQAWAIAFIVFTAASQVYRVLDGQEVGFAYYMQWFQILVLYLIFHDLGRDPRAFGYVWLAVAATAVFMAFVSLVPLPGFSVEAAGRRGFQGVNFNVQAYWYNLGMLTAVWLLIERFRRLSGWQVVLLLAVIALLFLALLRTGSRGGFISMLLGSVVLLALSMRVRNIKAYSTIIPGLLAGAIAAVLLTGLILARMSAAVSGEDDGARGLIWGAALEMIRDNLWIGYGPRFMPELGYAIGWESINTHQAYLQVTLAFGLPALFLWLGLIVSSARRCWRARRSPVGGLLVALLATSIMAGFTGDLGFDRYFWILLALAPSAAAYQNLLRAGAGSWRAELGMAPPRQGRTPRPRHYGAARGHGRRLV